MRERKYKFMLSERNSVKLKISSVNTAWQRQYKHRWKHALINVCSIYESYTQWNILSIFKNELFIKFYNDIYMFKIFNALCTKNITLTNIIHLSTLWLFYMIMFRNGTVLTSRNVSFLLIVQVLLYFLPLIPKFQVILLLLLCSLPSSLVLLYSINNLTLLIKK